MGKQIVVREVGVPVRAVNWVRLFPARGTRGEPCLIGSMGQQAGPLFVLIVDVETGACRQFPAPVADAHYPTAAFWSERRGCLFVGATPGHLFRFDPKLGRVEDLGLIHPDRASFPCGIDEAPDGMLYIGSYGACDLTRYDPERGEFTRFGRMDEVDQYFYPLCGRDGTVAGVVKMVRPHVVALDPASGAHRAVGPVADTDAGRGRVALIKGQDGLLYITSHEGDFRVRGLEVERVEAAPPPMSAPTLPDGSTFRFDNEGGRAFTNRRLLVTSPDGQTRALELDWQGDGTEIYLVRTGPDGKVYGSSILPLHFFSYDPATRELVNHGACSTSGGELYSMGTLGGRLYMCAYPAAKLSVYDPSRPYRFGTDADANPRELGRMDNVAYRPRDMLCGPAGKVWVASIPDYGMWGGTLSWFDPATQTFGSHRHIIRDCSPMTLAAVAEEGLIAVGFTVDGGSGTTPRPPDRLAGADGRGNRRLAPGGQLPAGPGLRIRRDPAGPLPRAAWHDGRRDALDRGRGRPPDVRGRASGRRLLLRHGSPPAGGRAMSPGQAAGTDNEQEKPMPVNRTIRRGAIPLWMLNDASSVSEKIEYMRACRRGGIEALCMHPRCGNLVPYGSDEWFEMIRRLVEEGRRLDMDMWLYDEDPFPSGAAGGLITRLRPDLRALALTRHERPPPVPLPARLGGPHALRDARA